MGLPGQEEFFFRGCHRRQLGRVGPVGILSRRRPRIDIAGPDFDVGFFSQRDQVGAHGWVPLRRHHLLTNFVLHLIERGLAGLETLVDLEKHIAIGDFDQFGDETRTSREDNVLHVLAQHPFLIDAEIAALFGGLLAFGKPFRHLGEQLSAVDALVNLLGFFLRLFEFLAGLAGGRDENLAELHAVLANELGFVLLVIRGDFLGTDLDGGSNFLVQHGLRHDVPAHLIHQVFKGEAELIRREVLELFGGLELVLLHDPVLLVPDHRLDIHVEIRSFLNQQFLVDQIPERVFSRNPEAFGAFFIGQVLNGPDAGPHFLDRALILGTSQNIAIDLGEDLLENDDLGSGRRREGQGRQNQEDFRWAQPGAPLMEDHIHPQAGGRRRPPDPVQL